tara:strand:- start:296 stop:634 length:339 start_codon:yes stop_codon:yes gene_type:complete
MTFLKAVAKPWNSKDRREHERSSGQSIKLRFAGSKYQSLDWSLGGCRIQDPPDRYKVGDMVEGTISGIGFSHSGEFLAEFVWRRENGQAGLRWLELEPHVFERLSRLRGRAL